MVTWISKNQEWLFSGAGLAVAAFFGRWLFNFARSRIQTVPPFDQSVFRTRPFPRELRDRIDAAAPIHRAARAKEIISLKIQWKTKLQMVHERGDDMVNLMLLDRGNYPWIECTVSKSKYPDLLLAGKGTVIWVAGSIAKYEAHTFSIRDPELRIVLGA